MVERKRASVKKRVVKKAVKKKAVKKVASKKVVKKVTKKASTKKTVKKTAPKPVSSKGLKSKFKGQLSIMDAVSKIADFAQADEAKLLTERKTQVMGGKKKGDLQGITEAFKTVHSYMRHLCRKGKKELKGLQAQRGVKAIMIMACQAGQKLENSGKGSKESLEAFEKLCSFYQEKMVKRFQQQMSSDALWEEEWEGGNMDLDLERKGLKDLNTVKKDSSYELFYLRQDDGSPFFNRSLLRHIKLVHEFDESFHTELDDPLLQVHRYKDMITHQMALDIKKEVELEAKAFYREIEHHKKVDIIANLHQMLISLLMACNSTTMAKNTSHKTSSEYFADFLAFFRQVLNMHEYKQIMHGTLEDTDSLSKVIFELIFKLSHALYTNTSDAPFISRFINKIAQAKGQKKWRESLGQLHTPELLSELLEIIDTVAAHLNLFPSGPLLKSFDILSDQTKVVEFDPILLENYPAAIFNFTTGKKEHTLLKVPSPTTQKYIGKAEIIDEFVAFLRGLEEKKQNLVYVNLQNKLSWKEHARCQAVEQVGKRKEYEDVFKLVSLNKGSEFYQQIADYEEASGAEDFMKAFKEQLLSNEGSGFSFPQGLKVEVRSFVTALLPLVHTLCFQANQELSKKDRMDFIEITYLFILLKVVHALDADYVSFSCKDGVDRSMNTTFAFYLLVKTLKGPAFFSEQELDTLLSILFRPPLIVRERVIDTHGFHRVSSALFTLLKQWYKTSNSKVIDEIQALYGKDFFKDLKLNGN